LAFKLVEPRQRGIVDGVNLASRRLAAGVPRHLFLPLADGFMLLTQGSEL
jgi:hypothetical protein